MDMEYTVKQLAKISGVTPRTLRYYDQIGLLAPDRVEKNGYRMYGQEQVDLLQQILFFRELGVDLETIRSLVYSGDFDREESGSTGRRNSGSAGRGREDGRTRRQAGTAGVPAAS